MVRQISILIFLCLGMMACSSADLRQSQGVPVRSATSVGELVRASDTTAACNDCLRFVEIQRIGSARDSVLLRAFPILVRARSGATIAAVPAADRQPIIRYAANGDVTVIGRYGQGPGEYRVVRGLAIGANDSLYVSHDARVSVFDANGDFARSLKSPIPMSGPLIPADTNVVVVGGMASPELVGVPLHALSPRGERVRSFGSEAIQQNSGRPQRVISSGSDKTIWSSEIRGNYRLEQLTLEGVVIRTLLVQPPKSWGNTAFLNRKEFDDWMKTVPRINMTKVVLDKSKRLPAHPVVVHSGTFQPSKEILWVGLNVPASDWRNVDVEYDAGEGGLISEETNTRLYRSVVDVLSLVDGRVIARGEIPGWGWLLNDGSFASFSFTADGIVQITLYRLDVISHEPQRR